MYGLLLTLIKFELLNYPPSLATARHPHNEGVSWAFLKALFQLWLYLTFQPVDYANNCAVPTG
jgi:hypothetical protein